MSVVIPVSWLPVGLVNLFSLLDASTLGMCDFRAVIRYGRLSRCSHMFGLLGEWPCGVCE